MQHSRYFFAFAILLILAPAPARAVSVAREWNEECLAAIRIDFPAPTVHARNLFHLSVAMYDAWAAYDTNAVGVLHVEQAASTNLVAARREAISYAAYRLLTNRYGRAVNSGVSITSMTERMTALGYDPAVMTTSGPSPAAVGNRVAASVLAFGLQDGANETGNYADVTGYEPVNAPLELLIDELYITDPNRWQPLLFGTNSLTQNGQPADMIQTFVGPHWGYVKAMGLDGPRSAGVYDHFDPGQPPQLGGDGDAAYKSNNLIVLMLSDALDPDSGDMIDISPAARGNNTLGYNDGTGYPSNPVTGAAYAPHVVKHGDFGRVIAEFWADGPASETPPGHWNVLANEVSEHPLLVKQIGGAGPVVDDLEWDVKLYLALNAAVHDAAVVAWGVKARYDYVRPISSIRYMTSSGQSSDPGGAWYNPHGIPLVTGRVEMITDASSAPGQRHAHLAAFKNTQFAAVKAWAGEPADPETDYGGSEWVMGFGWTPYQRSTFVTPAFAGYVSGHSTFSRAAAEVLTEFTGSKYFPGGLSVYTAAMGSLEFEYGPSEDIELQWATYYDASDEAGISRLYGGIHVPADDGPGRILGSAVGKAAYARASQYWQAAGPETELDLQFAGAHAILRWPVRSSLTYRLQSGPHPEDLTDVVVITNIVGFETEASLPADPASAIFRVVQE